MIIPPKKKSKQKDRKELERKTKKEIRSFPNLTQEVSKHYHFEDSPLSNSKTYVKDMGYKIIDI